jgi:hypothetical protein
MISKKAPVKAAARSKISHLVGYLLDQKGKCDRVAAVAATNCHSDDPKWAVHEMQAVQSRNQRAKGDRTYHLVISFRAGEDLPGDALAQIEDEFCRALGFAEHQRVSVVHRDTDHLHFHVAINKVHPTKFTLHEPFNDYHTRAKLCQQIEARYGLESFHCASKRNAPAQQKAAAMEAVAGVESLIGYVQRSLKNSMASARSWQELHQAFAKAGVALKPQGNGLVVESNGKMAKASSCFREMSKSALEKRFGTFQEMSQSAKVATPGKAYCARPMQKGSARLYEQYQTARREAKEEQCARLAEALAAHRLRVQYAKIAYTTQRTIIGLTRRSTVNTLMLQLHRASLKAKVAASCATYQTERSAIYREAKLLAWNDWLMTQAAGGNKAAQALLQSRRAKSSSPPPRPRTPIDSQPFTRSNARPDYRRSDLARAPVSQRPDYGRRCLRRAPLPPRPDYGRRPTLGTRILRRAVALLQSCLGKSGGKGPARPLASVRDVSRLDVVYERPRTEMLLRSDEPDRLGSEIGHDTNPAMRRPGNGAVGAGGERREGGSQSSGQGAPLAAVASLPAVPYATRNGTLRGAIKGVLKVIERAKRWTNGR